MKIPSLDEWMNERMPVERDRSRDHFFAWLAAEVQQALAISKDTSFLFEMHISICDPRLRLFFLLFFLEPRRKSMGMGIFTRLFSIFSRTPDDVFLKNASS